MSKGFRTDDSNQIKALQVIQQFYRSYFTPTNTHYLVGYNSLRLDGDETPRIILAAAIENTYYLQERGQPFILGCTFDSTGTATLQFVSAACPVNRLFEMHTQCMGYPLIAQGEVSTSFGYICPLLVTSGYMQAQGSKYVFSKEEEAPHLLQYDPSAVAMFMLPHCHFSVDSDKRCKGGEEWVRNILQLMGSVNDIHNDLAVKLLWEGLEDGKKMFPEEHFAALMCMRAWESVQGTDDTLEGKYTEEYITFFSRSDAPNPQDLPG